MVMYLPSSSPQIIVKHILIVYERRYGWFVYARSILIRVHVRACDLTLHAFIASLFPH